MHFNNPILFLCFKIDMVNKAFILKAAARRPVLVFVSVLTVVREAPVKVSERQNKETEGDGWREGGLDRVRISFAKHPTVTLIVQTCLRCSVQAVERSDRSARPPHCLYRLSWETTSSNCLPGGLPTRTTVPCRIFGFLTDSTLFGSVTSVCVCVCVSGHSCRRFYSIHVLMAMSCSTGSSVHVVLFIYCVTVMTRLMKTQIRIRDATCWCRRGHTLRLYSNCLCHMHDWTLAYLLGTVQEGSNSFESSWAHREASYKCQGHF